MTIVLIQLTFIHLPPSAINYEIEETEFVSLFVRVDFYSVVGTQLVCVFC